MFQDLNESFPKLAPIRRSIRRGGDSITIHADGEAGEQEDGGVKEGYSGEQEDTEEKDSSGEEGNESLGSTKYYPAPRFTKSRTGRSLSQQHEA